MALTAPRLGRALLAAALLAASGVAGCGGKDRPADASVATATPAPPAPRAGSPKPLCPRTGHWTDCIVFARLGDAGVAPRRLDAGRDTGATNATAPALPTLGPRPSLYRLGTSWLAVYLFADAEARARAARTLDTLHFVAPSAALTMRGEATAIENDNLLALLFSQRDQQRERVSDVFLAGAPQP